MAPMRIPRPAILESPDFSTQDYIEDRNADWNKSFLKAPVTWFINRLMRNAWPGRAAFMWKDPRISDEVDTSWRPVRMLGKGGFGYVGHWIQHDENGNTADEFAIKEAQIGLNYMVKGRHGLASEAAINRDLNQSRKGHNFVHLRRYKFHPEEMKARFYMIACPHGTLYQLRTLYRSWDTYLPELFLWHCFVALASAGLVMVNRPPNDTVALTEEEKHNSYILHLDLKPDNVLLDYPSHTDGHPIIAETYPRIRVADFTFSTYTNDNDIAGNPFNIKGCGTNHYRAPEQLDWGRGVLQVMPNAIDDQLDFNLNTWGIGRIMFDMLTLHPLEEYEQESYRQLQEEPHVYESEWKDNHVLPRKWKAKGSQNVREAAVGWLDAEYPQSTAESIPERGEEENENEDDESDYSRELRDLVRDCLYPAAERRPRPADLLERAQAGFDAYQAKMTATDVASGNNTEASNSLLFFADNEINHMPLGNANFAPDIQDLHELRNIHMPDCPALMFPFAKWGHVNTETVRDIDDVRFDGPHMVPVLRTDNKAAYDLFPKADLLAELRHRDSQASILELSNREPSELVAMLLRLDDVGIVGHGADGIEVNSLWPLREDYDKATKENLLGDLARRDVALRNKSFRHLTVDRIIDCLMAYDRLGMAGRRAPAPANTVEGSNFTGQGTQVPIAQPMGLGNFETLVGAAVAARQLLPSSQATAAPPGPAPAPAPVPAPTPAAAPEIPTRSHYEKMIKPELVDEILHRRPQGWRKADLLRMTNYTLIIHLITLDVAGNTGRGATYRLVRRRPKAQRRAARR